MTLSLEQLDQAVESAEVKTKPVPVPELGGSLVVRELTGTLRNAFEVAAAAVTNGNGGAKELESVTLRIVGECVLDAEGQSIGLVRARAIFAKKPSAVFRLRDEIVSLSAFSDEDLEELAEGFGEAQSVEPGSD